MILLLVGLLLFVVFKNDLLWYDCMLWVYLNVGILVVFGVKLECVSYDIDFDLFVGGFIVVSIGVVCVCFN